MALQVATWHFGQLQPWQQDLLRQAESVMKNAYNLMSHFFVGAAVLTESGRIYRGTFAENSSQPQSICAERVAITTANTERDRMYRAIAITGAHENGPVDDPVTPCGGCRRFIYDFAEIKGSDIEIICANTRMDKIYLSSIYELFPLPYGPRNCGQDLSRFRT